MSKKRKKLQQPTGNAAKSQRVQEWLIHITELLAEADYAGAIEACQRVLNFLPQWSPQRADAEEAVYSLSSLMIYPEPSELSLSSTNHNASALE